MIATYFSCTFSAWAVCVGVISVFLCSGQGGYARHILSLPVFTPMARLTFNAYLIHMIALTLVHGSNTKLQSMNEVRTYVQGTAMVVFCYAFSVFLFLIVEKPIMNLVQNTLYKRTPAKKNVLAQELDNEAQQQQLLQQPPAKNQGDEAMQMLDRRLSMISDVDSEALMLSPNGLSEALETELLDSIVETDNNNTSQGGANYHALA